MMSSARLLVSLTISSSRAYVFCFWTAYKWSIQFNRTIPESLSFNSLLSDIITWNFSAENFDNCNRFTTTVFMPCEFKFVWCHSAAGVVIWSRCLQALRSWSKCLESLCSWGSCLDQVFGVIPELEQVFGVIPEFEYVFGTGIWNHSGAGVVVLVLVEVVEVTRKSPKLYNGFMIILENRTIEKIMRR